MENVHGFEKDKMSQKVKKTTTTTTTKTTTNSLKQIGFAITPWS